MEVSAATQQTHNRSFRVDPGVAPLGEALWRLRLAPSALELHTALPPEVFVSPTLVDVQALAASTDVELLDIHAVLMLPPGPAEIIAGPDSSRT
jgi:hypothetical protein